MTGRVVQPIPEEAIRAGADILLEWQPMFETTHDVSTRIVEAAAPHIARAARIAELKRWAADLDEDVKGLDETARLSGTDIEGQERCEQQAVAVENIAESIRERITELESQGA